MQFHLDMRTEELVSQGMPSEIYVCGHKISHTLAQCLLQVIMLSA